MQSSPFVRCAVRVILRCASRVMPGHVCGCWVVGDGMGQERGGEESFGGGGGLRVCTREECERRRMDRRVVGVTGRSKEAQRHMHLDACTHTLTKHSELPYYYHYASVTANGPPQLQQD